MEKVVTLLLILSVNEASLVHDIDNQNSTISKCSAIMEGFAEAVSNYTLCAVKEATPFKFCRRCRHQYVNALDNGSLVYSNCKKDLILAEKHQIIGDTFDFVKNLWQLSNCKRKSVLSFYYQFIRRHRLLFIPFFFISVSYFLHYYRYVPTNLIGETAFIVFL